MDQKTKTILIVLLFVPIYFIVYTFLHEAGHALVIIACDGTIESFVFWNFGAHVISSGGTFTIFTEGLNYAAGMLLPTIVAAIAIGFYMPSVKFAAYHMCHFIAII